MFSSVTTQISLQFIRTYPTPQAAAALSYADFVAFARQHGYSQPKKLPACFAHLQAPQPQATPETVLVYQGEAVQPVPWTVIQDRLAARPGLATLLLATVQPVLPALDGRPGWPGTGVKNTELSELRQLFWQHDDAPTFDSLPGVGDFLAPGLLPVPSADSACPVARHRGQALAVRPGAKFGEDRQRFPTPASVQALAGTCPVTLQPEGRRQQWATRSRPRC